MLNNRCYDISEFTSQNNESHLVKQAMSEDIHLNSACTVISNQYIKFCQSDFLFSKW